MITNIFNQIRIIRRIKKGTWVKTKHRGWITEETYHAYLGYCFDPLLMEREHW